MHYYDFRFVIQIAKFLLQTVLMVAGHMTRKFYDHQKYILIWNESIKRVK